MKTTFDDDGEHDRLDDFDALEFADFDAITRDARRSTTTTWAMPALVWIGAAGFCLCFWVGVVTIVRWIV